VKQKSPVRKGGRSSFVSDALKLVGGTASSQGLTMLITPILSRLYAPDAFGTMAVFVSITSIIGAIACLRYQFAIVVSEHDEDAANLLAVSLFFVLVVAGLTAGLVLLGGELIARWLRAPDVAPYLGLVPVAVLADGGYLALSYWSSRRKQFGRVSIARILQSAAKNGVQLGVGVARRVQVGGLLGGRVFGSVLATAVLGGQTWRDDRELLSTSIRWARMLAGMKRYKIFPLVDTWSVLLNAVSVQLPTLLLSIFFSGAVVGYYSMGVRAIQLPVTLVGTAIGQVFFQRAARANIKGDLASIVGNVFQRLVAYGLFPFLALAIVGRDVFVVVFGKGWSEAGVYAQILSLWIFFVFTSSPMSTLVRVLERQQMALYLNCVLVVSRGVSLIIGGYIGNARLGLGLFSVSGVIVLGWYTFRILRLARLPRQYGISVLLRYMLNAVPGLIVLIALQLSGSSSAVLTAVAVLLILVYETIAVSKEPEVLAQVHELAHNCCSIISHKRWKKPR